MSANWYLIDNPVYTEGTEQDDFDFYSDKGFVDYITDTPLLAKNTYLCNSALSSEVLLNAIIQNNTSDSVSQDKLRQALVQIGTITNQSYIKTANTYWLIETRPSTNGIYDKVIIQCCNYKLRWQNSNNEIVERWVVSQDASSYSTGVEDNKQITLGSDQLMIYIPADEETISVLRDKRFMIDANTNNPTCYKLTRVDTTTYTINGIGYCAWIVTEDVYNPQTDSIEQMICDYISPTTPIQSDIEITYNGQAQIRVGGSAKTFMANTDNEITIWSKVCTASQEDYIILTSDINDGNKCKVKCMGDTSLIGSEFKLQCTDGTNNGELLISIVGGV